MINSQEIKIGTCIRMDGKIWTCIDFQHRKPGKGNTVMITKLKNVADGRVLERTFQVGFKLEDVRVERRPYQYLYEDIQGSSAKSLGTTQSRVMLEKGACVPHLLGVLTP